MTPSPISGPTVRRHEPDDQASGLRRLLASTQGLKAVGLHGPDAALNVQAASNLAFALSQRGSSVCLIDEVPGPENCAARFGLSPSRSLADVLHGRFRLDDVLVAVTDHLHMLPAVNGLALAAESDAHDWSRLGQTLAERDLAWLLLAAPADDQACLALAAPLRILILPPQKARLTEAYAVLKAVHNRQPDVRWLAMSMATETEAAEQVVTSLSETAQRFLGLEVGLLGAIPRDQEMERATRAMRPVLDTAPDALSSQAMRQVAERLDGWPLAYAERTDMVALWQRAGLLARIAYRTGRVRHAAHRGHAYG